MNTDLNLAIMDLIAQAPNQPWMDTNPTLDEVKLALNLMSNGKAPGADGIHLENIRRRDTALLESIHKVIDNQGVGY